MTQKRTLKVDERDPSAKMRIDNAPQDLGGPLASTSRHEAEKKQPDAGLLSSDDVFDQLDSEEFVPKDTMEVFTESIEASVGYSSLIRLLNESYHDRITFFMSERGGSLNIEEARKKAFRRCEDTEEAKKYFRFLHSLPVDALNFGDLGSLWRAAPRVAERLWEQIKVEARKEFESGHSAANTVLPPGLTREAWQVARYLGVRESFISEWKPRGGIEISLIDMLAQTWFQWQYWLEQSILRAQTEPRREHRDYREWKARMEEQRASDSSGEGYWFQPYVSEQEALDHAVQMVDRWNRMYVRTLRQLRDLRRFSPVTINNAKQVNIAAEGGNQINSTES